MAMSIKKSDKRPGEMLKILRENLSYERKKVADAFKVGADEIAQYENGKKVMGISEIEAAATFFKVPISTFFKYVDPKKDDLNAVIDRAVHEYEIVEILDKFDNKKRVSIVEIMGCVAVIGGQDGA